MVSSLFYHKQGFHVARAELIHVSAKIMCIYSNNKYMCVFLISPVAIAEPLTSEFIDTPVFHNLAPRPIKYRVSVPIPTSRYTSQENSKFAVRMSGSESSFHPIELCVNQRISSQDKT